MPAFLSQAGAKPLPGACRHDSVRQRTQVPGGLSASAHKHLFLLNSLYFGDSALGGGTCVESYGN
jgi:hypothetical protein